MRGLLERISSSVLSVRVAVVVECCGPSTKSVREYLNHSVKKSVLERNEVEG